MKVCEFTQDQLAALRSYGVLNEQVVRLAAALPLCASITDKAPRMGDVRDQMDMLEAPLLAAQKRMRRFLNPVGRQQEGLEARVRVQLASYDAGGGGNELEDALKAVGDLLATLREARDDLPKIERRLRLASPWPIHLIEKALSDGWREAHSPVSVDDDARPSGTHAPPYPFTASVSVTSKFRDVVSLCYDAFLGTRDSDPERAFKAFMAARAPARRRIAAERRARADN